MVHALQTIRDLLALDGVLIDLRPKGWPAEFRGYRAGTPAFLGHLQEIDDYIEYRHAAWAMEQAVDNQWFHLTASGEYEFIIHADSLEEMTAYLATDWTDAVVPIEVQTLAERLGVGKVTLRDLVHIGILRVGELHNAL